MKFIAWQLSQIMTERKITKVEMARRLSTSRAQLDRLLDPENDSVTLGMLTRAAASVGRKIKLELK
ncbi:MAG: helix-turn-helix domain-containing protein [Reyranella sp.]|uniref:helix-turn-helix domain-containing protein n=1 Tax=Reyranella sp. TaxID=1929291 RepID=UPI003D0F537A